MLSAFSSCLKDEPFKLYYYGFQPVDRNDGWQISTPENENMDRALLDVAYQLLDSVNQTLFSIYPEHFTNHPEKSNITLHHALTMTTGIDFYNSINTKTLYETEKSSVEFVLSLNKKYEPGVVFKYHDGAPQLLSAAVQKRYGAPFSEFANENLFKPLGITEW